MTNNIIVEIDKNNNAFLEFNDLITKAYIGKNGASKNKIEGDNKTPLGEFELGISFGTHKNIETLIDYYYINENLYWVDDINSKHYNKLVDITKIEKDWSSAEHLSDYKNQYEYAIEIKSNPNNIKGKGSAIFIHCSTNNKTAGCIAIPRDDMIELLKNIDRKTKIIIKLKGNKNGRQIHI